MTNTPTLKCPRQIDQFTIAKKDNIGNGELTYPIGLITIDEEAHAGGKLDSVNLEYYLNDGNLSNGEYYMTMSPSIFTPWSAAAFMMEIGNKGEIKQYLNPYREHYFRPVINLKSGVTIKSGNGTKKNPYILN